VAITRAKARLYLPLVPNQLGGKQWKGGYRRLNDRLGAVVKNMEFGDEQLFKLIPFQSVATGTENEQERQPIHSPESWQPPKDLLKSRDVAGEFAGYRYRHAGYEVSSYSRMKREWTSELNPLERDEFHREVDRESISVSPTASGLPRGTSVGLMLHEILEKVPFDSAVKPHAFVLEAWRSLVTVAELINAAMAKNSIDQIHRVEVEAIVYHALTFDIPLDQGQCIPGLGSCTNNVREMEFLFPFPESDHPKLPERNRRKIIIGRGFIKGFVDLVVEHKGRVYFGDWKSDILPSYNSEALGKHVADHYELQAKLYALALVKAMSVYSEDGYERMFGGLFYVFLRSFRTREPADPETGVYYSRPSWAQILSYEDELRQFAKSASGGRS
jgi:exodeoxyribonuclease V beta subunit